MPQPTFLQAVRYRLFDIIFEADTPAGKAFDVGLFIVIAVSVLAVILESVESVGSRWQGELNLLEWSVTLLFTLEYVCRIWVVDKPIRYVTSFFGVVDLLSILPTYLSLFVVGGQYLMVVRAIRLLRVFRVLKMAHFLGEANVLGAALRASARKITVFIMVVITLVIIIGTLMYLLEGPEHGFKNIPLSMYWAVVTLTTVGFGDIAPQTPLGQFFAAVLMVMGYGIIAVPTGIVSVELAQVSQDKITTRVCHACSHEGHALDAIYCKFCGHKL